MSDKTAVELVRELAAAYEQALDVIDGGARSRDPDEGRAVAAVEALKAERDDLERRLTEASIVAMETEGRHHDLADELRGLRSLMAKLFEHGADIVTKPDGGAELRMKDVDLWVPLDGKERVAVMGALEPQARPKPPLCRCGHPDYEHLWPRCWTCNQRTEGDSVSCDAGEGDEFCDCEKFEMASADREVTR